MSVPLSPNFTIVENVSPEIKPLEQEELMISTEWLKKIVLKSAVTCFGITCFRTEKTVTKPNRNSCSIGGASDKVKKERTPNHLILSIQ